MRNPIKTWWDSGGCLLLCKEAPDFVGVRAGERMRRMCWWPARVPLITSWESEPSLSGGALLFSVVPLSNYLAESDQLPVLATGSRDAFEKLFFLFLDVFSFVAFSSLPCQPPEAVFGFICCAKHPERPGPSALCCSSCLRISCSLTHCFPSSLKPSMAWGQEPVPTGSGFPIDANVSGTVT